MAEPEPREHRSADDREIEPTGEVHVVATAGHVDHGKSSLVVRLTGIDPDRLAEEKRRGLTIDLGFAWCTLPSGREIGFVDVPGHERFIRTMLAGVGPVRLVLFVVAADEGWKPQSEEHLEILDVLGVDAGVIALTKRDLVDEETLVIATAEVAERVHGTVLAGAPIVGCSSATGEGIDELRAALDAAAGSAPVPERDGRARLHVDRVFAISGAGTVVTGTLTGGGLRVGDDVVVLPAGARARVRGLQTHKRRLREAAPVSRVAVNLVGVDRADVERGDVLAHPGAWLPTDVVDVSLAPVRGVAHPIAGRGAFKVYAGAAEREARVRIFGAGPLRPGERGYARIRLGASLVLDVGDRFVIRDAGRDETVAGGTVLDPHPPSRAGADAAERLAARERASGRELPALVVSERRAILGADVEMLLGATVDRVDGAVRAGEWLIAEPTFARASAAALDAAAEDHRSQPLQPGAPIASIRAAIAASLPPTARASTDAILRALVDDGSLVREASVVRLPGHRAAVEERGTEIDAVVAAVAAAGAMPPTIRELIAAGHARAIVDAAVRGGLIVKIAPDLVVTTAMLERALAEIASAGPNGMTVSELRERLGTSRKYAVPILEHLDSRGRTVRRGDVRVVRGAG
jgi:selenocysteine-specific elongation factor